jgi:phosphate/phosphite/phosphonate ABC transporter binding protein
LLDPPSPGRVVAGRYRLGSLVGEGGMGSVYEAEHLGLSARVAVKLLADGYLSDAKALARFKREARALGSLRHDNVVSVLDAGTDVDGSPFLVMELLEGESLSSMLRRERRLESHVACWVANQVLGGLMAAHARGVVHRDLKPGNVFVSRQSDGSHRVKILDFGVSKLLGSSTLNVTAQGAIVGTPNCMAPEQLTGEVDSDPRIDIYAAGVLLYRMVTGRLPYKGTSSEELFRRIVEGQLSRPCELNPAVPIGVEQVILRAIAPHPDDRFQDAASMRQALSAAAPGIDDSSVVTPAVISRGNFPPSPPISFPPPLVDPASGTAPTLPASPGALRETEARPRRRRGPIYATALVTAAAAVAAFFVLAELRSTTSAAASDEPPLRLGLVRYLPAALVADEHRAMIRYLTERLGRRVELVIAEDDDELSDRLLSGELEVAALSPYNYVRTHRRQPDLRLLASPVTPAGTSSYEGYVLTRVDSGVERLEDLAGRVFCYVRPDSTSGYLYPRALFRKIGLDPDASFSATRFGGDHLNTLRDLDRGACDGAAVYGSAWFTAREHGLAPERFRLLATTERIPFDAYVAGPHLSDEVSGAIADALLALAPGSDTATSALRAAGANIIGFGLAKDADYDPVRAVEDSLDRPR